MSRDDMQYKSTYRAFDAKEFQFFDRLGNRILLATVLSPDSLHMQYRQGTSL